MVDPEYLKIETASQEANGLGTGEVPSPSGDATLPLGSCALMGADTEITPTIDGWQTIEGEDDETKARLDAEDEALRAQARQNITGPYEDLFDARIRPARRYASHLPAVHPEAHVSEDVESAIQDCTQSNYWSVLSAMEAPRYRKPLEVILVLESDVDEEPTKVSWGGGQYTSDEDFSGPNEIMVEGLLANFGSSFDDSIDKDEEGNEAPLNIPFHNEDGSITDLRLYRYPIKGGWTIEALTSHRHPLPPQRQLEHFERGRQDNFEWVNPRVEDESTGLVSLNIWVCPPDMSLSRLYTQSDKPTAEGVVRNVEDELTSTQF